MEFTNEQRLGVRRTCNRGNVRGRQGQWARGDGSRNRDTLESLVNGRIGELAGAAMVRQRYPNWTVENPNFALRNRRQRDLGDFKVTREDGSTFMVEVKSITNRGAFTSECINQAGLMGYVFQRIKYTYRTRTMDLTPTFDPDHHNHEAAMERKLIGVIVTPRKGGGVSATISKSVFLKPVYECEFINLRHMRKEDADLKRATVDPCVV